MISIKNHPEQFQFDSQYRVGRYHIPDEIDANVMSSSDLRALADYMDHYGLSQFCFDGYDSESWIQKEGDTISEELEEKEELRLKAIQRSKDWAKHILEIVDSFNPPLFNITNHYRLELQSISRHGIRVHHRIHMLWKIKLRDLLGSFNDDPWINERDEL